MDCTLVTKKRLALQYNKVGTQSTTYCFPLTNDVYYKDYALVMEELYPIKVGQLKSVKLTQSD